MPSAYSRTTRLLSPLADPLLGRREELAAAESAGADAADERWACELLAAARGDPSSAALSGLSTALRGCAEEVRELAAPPPPAAKAEHPAGPPLAAEAEQAEQAEFIRSVVCCERAIYCKLLFRLC